MPVLLTDTGSLDPDTKAYLSSIASTLTQLHIIGGTSAVSSATATAADAVVATVVRHAGGNRYSTATQAASDFFKGSLAPQKFGLASGTNFPDSLTGGLWAALHLSPLLLSDPSTLSSETSTYLTANAGTIDSGAAFGGTSALKQAVLDAASALY
ncbi:MAG: cell wall-binding repeat-containing protein [Candidatus Andersenbacteria bacterium]